MNTPKSNFNTPFSCIACHRLFRMPFEPGVTYRPCPDCGKPAYMLKVNAPFACLVCQRSFKRPIEPGVSFRPCPHCGEPARQLDQKFKPPKKSDDKAWAIVAYLVRNGYDFQSYYHMGTYDHIHYPKTLTDARLFIEKYKLHKLSDGAK